MDYEWDPTHSAGVIALELFVVGAALCGGKPATNQVGKSRRVLGAGFVQPIDTRAHRLGR